MIDILKINETEHLGKYQTELAAFFSLYERCFPDDNEREDPDIICNRIKGVEKRQVDPVTTILLALEDRMLQGGCIVEYYSACECMLLTYIAVEASARGKGISHKLIDSGIKTLIETKNNRVKALFFESNIPWETSEDAFNPWDRFSIFNRLGAKWIDINYVQPPLDPRKAKVTNLFLFTIPHLTNLGFEIEKSVLAHFLEVFYIELGINEPHNDEDFIRMMEKIKLSSESNSIILKEVPHLENDVFCFSDVSVAFHIADPDTKTTVIANKQNNNCHVMGSYEFDLLQYRFQKAQPFSSQIIPLAGKSTCRIYFPHQTTYISEGRYETLIGKSEYVELEIHLNNTLFNNGRRVWTLVLSPVSNTHLLQDEVIRLLSLFANTQEKNNIKRDTKIFYNNSEYTTFWAFAQDVCNIQNHSQIEIIPSGILQLDVVSAKSQMVNTGLWEETIGLIDGIARNNLEAYNELETKYLDKCENIRYVLNLLCGLSLGIFDYWRMSFEEVMDTIKPLSTTGHSFIAINKGIILSVGYDDDMYRKTRQTIGINPYLLISSAVLAFNDLESMIAESKINALLNMPSKEQTLPRLIKERKELERKVNNEILINIFHYQTERSIFDFGMVHRGVEARVRELETGIKELGTRIEDNAIEKKAKSDLMITILLAAISVLSLEQTFNSIFSAIHRSGSFSAAMAQEGDKWMTFATFSLVAILLTTYFARKSVARK